MSLATGLSPRHLLQYKQLIDEGVLIKGGSSKKPEYRLRLHLDITKQKVETLKIHQLNKTVTHDLHVSSSWFEHYAGVVVHGAAAVVVAVALAHDHAGGGRHANKKSGGCQEDG